MTSVILNIENYKTLIDNCADVHIVDQCKRTALHWAASASNEEAMLALIKAGCDISQLDSQLRTPLHLAAQEGASTCCRILLEHGADPYLLDGERRSPIDLARKGYHEDALKLMVSVYCSNFHLMRSKTKYFCGRCLNNRCLIYRSFLYQSNYAFFGPTMLILVLNKKAKLWSFSHMQFKV